jgi:hypothetical protein
MKDSCFLVLSEYGIERMTKKQGVLKRGEVAVRVSVNIADKHFAEPTVSAHIDVPDCAVIQPQVNVDVEQQQ